MENVAHFEITDREICKACVDLFLAWIHIKKRYKINCGGFSKL
jgi:hypothetical protein